MFTNHHGQQHHCFRLGGNTNVTAIFANTSHPPHPHTISHTFHSATVVARSLPEFPNPLFFFTRPTLPTTRIAWHSVPSRLPRVSASLTYLAGLLARGRSPSFACIHETSCSLVCTLSYRTPPLIEYDHFCPFSRSSNSCPPALHRLPTTAHLHPRIAFGSIGTCTTPTLLSATRCCTRK